MAAPTPFLPGLARGEEWSENGGPGGSRRWEKGMDGGDPPQPSGPSQTRCCPPNLQVLPSQGCPFAPTSPAGPLNLYPPSLPMAD